MLLTDAQQQKANDGLKLIRSRDRHQIENGLATLRSLGDDAKPYLTYLLRSSNSYTQSILIALDTYRDSWAAQLLYEILETSESQNQARTAWNSLRSMGKLPKEWRSPKFTNELWEKCRTKPSEIPVTTESEWIPIVKWNLLFKLMEDDKIVKDQILDEFGYIGTKATLGLLSALEEGDSDLSKTALLVLKRVGDSRAVEPLQTLLTHEDSIIRVMAKSALQAVSPREYQPPQPSQQKQHLPPSQETLKQREEWSKQIMSPSISGQFDPQLERRVVRALLRAFTPDPDEKIAGWKEFERLGESALPILRYYADAGTDAQKQQAQAVIKSNFSG